MAVDAAATIAMALAAALTSNRCQVMVIEIKLLIAGVCLLQGGRDAAPTLRLLNFCVRKIGKAYICMYIYIHFFDYKLIHMSVWRWPRGKKWHTFFIYSMYVYVCKSLVKSIFPPTFATYISKCKCLYL